MDDQEWKDTRKGIFLEALDCFIKGEEPERKKEDENQEEITRSLEEDDRVHQNFRLSSSSFIFSFYYCWIFNLDMF